jgi:hypothetical protein
MLMPFEDALANESVMRRRLGQSDRRAHFMRGQSCVWRGVPSSDNEYIGLREFIRLSSSPATPATNEGLHAVPTRRALCQRRI